MSDINHIGSSIRSLRKSKEITLQELSKKTGLSIGYLSNLERNLCSPTLQNVQKICDVLGNSLTDLLERNAEAKIVVRKKDREVTMDEISHLRLETIDFGTGSASLVYMFLEEKSPKEIKWQTHNFDEIGTVITGRLETIIDDKKFELQEGDSILIKAHSRHSYFNSGSVPSISCWVRVYENKKFE